MIFGAHFAINDATKELSAPDSVAVIQKTFQMQLPRTALELIGAMLALIIDRIHTAVSAKSAEWLRVLTPFLCWLTMHKEDGLLAALMAKHPQIPLDLARIMEPLTAMKKQL